MKFGREYHRHLVPQWASSSVNYAQLKQDYKLAVMHSLRLSSGLGADFTRLSSTLGDSIEALNTFYYQQHEFVIREYGFLCEYFGIDTSSSSRIPVLHSAPLAELLVLSQALSQLEKHIARLQLYLRVNEHAISKIYAKVRAMEVGDEASGNAFQSRWLRSSESRVREAQCLRLSQILTSLGAKVTSACRAASAKIPSESLHLRTVFLRLKLDIKLYSEVLLLIGNDQHERLIDFCRQYLANGTLPPFQAQELFSGLFHTAFVHHSGHCLRSLIFLANKAENVFMESACIIDLVKLHCRPCRPSFGPRSTTSNQIADIKSLHTREHILLELFQQLDLGHEGGLHYHDKSGRLLLHYVAEYGLTSICVLVLNSSKDDSGDVDSAAKWILSPDFQNETPLHCAVISNHLDITRLFLRYLKPNGSAGFKERAGGIFVEVMIIAIMLGFDEIVELFISAQVGISEQNSRGETALYMAAKIGRDDYVGLLLQDPSTRSAIDRAQYAYGWSPLFIACVEGHSVIAELLLHAGADCTLLDIRGWSVKDHAAFRGYVELATLLHPWTRTTSTCNLPGTYRRPGAVGNNTIAKDYSYVVVNLGSLQKNRLLDPVKLIPPVEGPDSPPVPEIGLWLELSIRGEDTRRRVQLPLIDELANEPFVLPCHLSERSQLVFNLYRETATLHSLEEELIGSGTVLIENGHQLDHKRESLVREFVASIMARDTLECIGLVAFTMVISKPYTKLDNPLEGGYWFREDNIQITGHRGLGQNLQGNYLQLGENTVQSFLSAMKQGASWVEVRSNTSNDLQVTRDLVPVAYHDLSLSESGTDVPIHDLSLEQFLYAGRSQRPQIQLPALPSHATSPTNENENSTNKTTVKRRRVLSLVQKQQEGPEAQALQDRMKHTFDFTDKGFKPNTRGDFIQEEFPTLEGLLRELPEHVKLDIEVKYPRVHETSDADIAPVAIEINIFVDKVLDVLQEFAGRRVMILSSFSPEVCILLKLKQHKYPVMFITNAGKPPDKDKEVRTASVQAAVHFANLWSLAGVCFASEPLILCPRLIAYTKSRGLGCASYGPLNNVPENAKTQGSI
ncbi:hypothetical protein A1O3_09980 [Capronia epimyces CBS 606.96]|uniref:Uncharacterized protein n=1 Tax=Capronia epimyces CBS 606.96 TaxID=1182542 RepID=W9XLA2_9EURO|nr:uncharacterized protein A1O3_09980 [Capronia epimyces CBS 606.96]EXJ77751.1 hypothetical protein A1O3_09980 [Capronia epimyces CBS 606.96]